PAAFGKWVDSARIVRGATAKAAPRHGLLQLDLGASGLELLLDLLGFGLGNAFLDRLRSALDQVLGLLQAETGDGAHFLDDLDLLVASGSQDDVELGLL